MYKNTKKIAILLAAYNAELYITEQIESIISQTNKDWTLYIRNDGSTDKTGEIISEYCEKFSNIIEIDKGGKNFGCRNNFFRLLEVVESDYYMFCDADDVWLPIKVQISFEKLYEIELKNPNVPILAHSDAVICDKDLNVISDSYWKSTGINARSFTHYNYLCVCCTVGGAKSIFNKKVKDMIFPLEDNEFMFDYWIAMNVAKYGIVSVIDTPTILYRQHSSNLLGVTVGDDNSIYNKLRNSFSLIKLYKRESDALRKVGYGGFVKYMYYKMLVVFKIRFYKY